MEEEEAWGPTLASPQSFGCCVSLMGTGAGTGEANTEPGCGNGDAARLRA